MTKKKPPAPEYQFLAVTIRDFTVRLDTGIDYHVRDEHLRRENFQVQSYGTHIEILGDCTYPDDRAGAEIEFSVYSGTFYEDDVKSVVKSFRAYDKDYQPMSRKVRGEYRPIYNLPKGVGLLEKRRGENRWQSHLRAEKAATSDMLNLLGRFNPLYVSVHEMKFERKRWIVNFGLQTSDPAYE